MPSLLWHSHAWRNLLQTLLLIIALFGIAALAGFVLFSEDGLWIALAASGIALVVEPAMAARMTLRLYRARPIAYHEAPELWNLMQQIAERAGLPAIPALHYTLSAIIWVLCGTLHKAELLSPTPESCMTAPTALPT